MKLIGGPGLRAGSQRACSVLCFGWRLAGGALALVYKARDKKDLAYVPAIAVGVLVETIWPGGIADVLLK